METLGVLHTPLLETGLRNLGGGDVKDEVIIDSVHDMFVKDQRIDFNFYYTSIAYFL